MQQDVLLTNSSLVLLIWGADSAAHSDWKHVTMQLQIDLAEDYPGSVPSIRFVTPVFHPNGK